MDGRQGKESIRRQKSIGRKRWRVFRCSLNRESDGQHSLPSWLFSPQSRHRTHRFGRDGPEPHHEHERPRLCGKEPGSCSFAVVPSSESRCSSSFVGTLLLSEPIQQVCAFNRTVSKVHDFLQNEAKGSKVIGAGSLEDMVSKLKKPRRIILLVKAGTAVDDFINKLVGSLVPNCPVQTIGGLCGI